MEYRKDNHKVKSMLIFLAMTIVWGTISCSPHLKNKPNEMGSLLKLEFLHGTIIDSNKVELIFRIHNLNSSRTLVGATFYPSNFNERGSLSFPPRLHAPLVAFTPVPPQGCIEAGMILDRTNRAEHDLAVFFFNRITNDLSDEVLFHAGDRELIWR
jgi:hypothetical protein